MCQIRVQNVDNVRFELDPNGAAAKLSAEALLPILEAIITGATNDEIAAMIQGAENVAR